MREFQRIGSYGVIMREGALLLTRISARGYPAGWWGLPGGGIDHGESPRLALVRELHEETGLEPLEMRLVDVHDVHTQAPGRGDEYEDYHGIHLLYAVEVPPDAVPRVVEQEGTTDDVRWIPVDLLRAGPNEAVLPVVDYVVERIDQFARAVGAAGDAEGLGSGDTDGVQNSTA